MFVLQGSHCEDLASLDEWAELVRSAGPSLVVALLLDGPQLAARWPCRYSSVLVDDPGSAVLHIEARRDSECGCESLAAPAHRFVGGEMSATETSTPVFNANRAFS
jgi:hypothetical protein